MASLCLNARRQQGGGLLRTLAFASEAISISSSRMPTRSCAIRRAPLLPQADIYILLWQTRRTLRTLNPTLGWPLRPCLLVWSGMAAQRNPIASLAWRQLASGARLATQVLNQRDAKDASSVILIQELGGQSVSQCKKTAGVGHHGTSWRTPGMPLLSS